MSAGGGAVPDAHGRGERGALPGRGNAEHPQQHQVAAPKLGRRLPLAAHAAADRDGRFRACSGACPRARFGPGCRSYLGACTCACLGSRHGPLMNDDHDRDCCVLKDSVVSHSACKLHGRFRSGAICLLTSPCHQCRVAENKKTEYSYDPLDWTACNEGFSKSFPEPIDTMGSATMMCTLWYSR